MKHLDGWLYVGVAVCAALTASLGSDEAMKYFTPDRLFGLKTITGAVGAGLLAAKMYRSTTFARSQTPPENLTASAAAKAMADGENAENAKTKQP
jgi:hypothetical protein